MDTLTPMFCDTSYRQLGSYATAAAERVGAKSELNGLFEDQTLIGLADVRVKTVPMISLGIAYMSHAPIMRRDGTFSTETFTRCVEALCQEYVERRRLLLRVVPALVGGQFQELQTTAMGSPRISAMYSSKFPTNFYSRSGEAARRHTQGCRPSLAPQPRQG